MFFENTAFYLLILIMTIKEESNQCQESESKYNQVAYILL